MSSKSNGQNRGPSLQAMFSFENSARTLPLPARWGLWAWLRAWLSHPRRVFWQLDPGTGEWKRLQ